MSENTNATDHPGQHAQLYQHETMHNAPTLQQLYDNTQIGNYTYDPGHGRSSFQGKFNQEFHNWTNAASLDQLMRPPSGAKPGLTLPADSTLDPTYQAPAVKARPPARPTPGTTPLRPARASWKDWRRV